MRRKEKVEIAYGSLSSPTIFVYTRCVLVAGCSACLEILEPWAHAELYPSTLPFCHRHRIGSFRGIGPGENTVIVNFVTFCMPLPL